MLFPCPLLQEALQKVTAVESASKNQVKILTAKTNKQMEELNKQIQDLQHTIKQSEKTISKMRDRIDHLQVLAGENGTLGFKREREQRRRLRQSQRTVNILPSIFLSVGEME